MNVFFNTQSKTPLCCLQLTGEFLLTPVRFWHNGYTFQENTHNLKLDDTTYVTIKSLGEERDIVQIAATPDYWEGATSKKLMPIVIKVLMALLYLPSLIAGFAFKLVAHLNCFFPLCLKPVIKQQYNYNKFKTPQKLTLENAVKTATKRTFCSYKGQTFELLKIKTLASTRTDTSQAVHCKHDLLSVRSKAFKQDFHIDATQTQCQNTEQETILSQQIITGCSSLFARWNPPEPDITISV